MALIRHELRQGRISLMIWTVVIAFMLAVCVLIYPEMSDQMDDVGSMFSEMGSFSEAFGIDKLNFGEFMGFFGVECGNVLGLGGAFFAALMGISILAKEEKEQTAEFLLTHPISRKWVLSSKFAALMLQIFILNILVILVTALSICAIGEKPEIRTLALLFLAYFILQIEIASVSFGISAFLSHGSLGIGLGMAALLYFLNIIANLTEDAEFLKYITPFGYAEGSDIIADGCLNTGYLIAGIIFTVIGIGAAYYWYCKKDIRA